MVRAIVCSRDESLAAWLKLRTAFDSHCNNPEFYRLLPQLYLSLVDKKLDDELLPLLRGVYKKNWYTNVLLLKRAAEILGKLSAAKIDTVVLNGIPLALLFYKNIGALYIFRIDILVQYEARHEALTVLNSLGFTVEQKSTRLDLPNMVGLKDASGCLINLHCFLTVESPEESADRQIWRRAVALDVQGAQTKTIDDSSTLLHLCVQGFSTCSTSGAWVLDALQVINTAPMIDWDYVLAVARQRKVTYQLRTTFTYLVREFRAQIPEQVLQHLAQSKLTALEWCDQVWSEHATADSLSARILTHCRRIRSGESRPSISGTFDYIRLRIKSIAAQQKMKKRI